MAENTIKNSEIKKFLQDGRVIIGTEKTIQNLKLGKVEKVVITSNTPDKVIEDINRYSEMAGAEVIKADYPNEEMGIICKKPYSISVLSILKVK